MGASRAADGSTTWPRPPPRLRRPLGRRLVPAPLLCAALEAAAIVGDAEFAATHVDVLRPLQDYVAIAGSGGLVLGPIALAVARADLAPR